jgi:hypothetical protein
LISLKGFVFFIENEIKRRANDTIVKTSNDNFVKSDKKRSAFERITIPIHVEITKRSPIRLNAEDLKKSITVEPTIKQIAINNDHAIIKMSIK